MQRKCHRQTGSNRSVTEPCAAGWKTYQKNKHRTDQNHVAPGEPRRAEEQSLSHHAAALCSCAAQCFLPSGFSVFRVVGDSRGGAPNYRAHHHRKAVLFTRISGLASAFNHFPHRLQVQRRIPRRDTTADMSCDEKPHGIESTCLARIIAHPDTPTRLPTHPDLV